METTFTMTPVGLVTNHRDDPVATDFWADVESTIALDERFGPECLHGLAEFSHVEVLFVFDRAAYPGPTLERLRRIKARHDLSNLYRHNDNIPPAAS